MDSTKYLRKVQCSVTNFLFCGDDYLFLHRKSNKKIDPNKLNGIGGRLEEGENYLDAAIRETEEETGYKVSPSDIKFSGIVKLEGGYEEDWVMCFFKIKVATKEIPLGEDTIDGKLVWLNKEKVLESGYELVDDLNYVFKDLVEEESFFFMNAKVNTAEKIESASVSKIPFSYK